MPTSSTSTECRVCIRECSGDGSVQWSVIRDQLIPNGRQWPALISQHAFIAPSSGAEQFALFILLRCAKSDQFALGAASSSRWGMRRRTIFQACLTEVHPSNQKHGGTEQNDSQGDLRARIEQGGSYSGRRYIAVRQPTFPKQVQYGPVLERRDQAICYIGNSFSN